MATERFVVGGHEADDIDLLVESSVPLFAKRSGEATARPAVNERIPILVAAVVGMDFVPQPVQHRRPALVRGRGRFSEQPVPPPATVAATIPPIPMPTLTRRQARPPLGEVGCASSGFIGSVPYRMKSSPRWKTIRRTLCVTGPAGKTATPAASNKQHLRDRRLRYADQTRQPSKARSVFRGPLMVKKPWVDARRQTAFQPRSIRHARSPLKA